MLPNGWPPLPVPVADEAGVAAEVEEEEEALETPPVKLAPAGSVSVLKNISRLLCNCRNKRTGKRRRERERK